MNNQDTSSASGRVSFAFASSGVRAKVLQEFPAEHTDDEQGDNHPNEIAQQFAHLLHAVAKESAEHDVERDPQRFTEHVVEKKARPRIAR